MSHRGKFLMLLLHSTRCLRKLITAGTANPGIIRTSCVSLQCQANMQPNFRTHRITSPAYRVLGAWSLRNASEIAPSQGRKPTAMVLSVNCGQPLDLWFGKGTHFSRWSSRGKVGGLCAGGTMGIDSFTAAGDVRWLRRLSRR